MLYTQVCVGGAMKCGRICWSSSHYFSLRPNAKLQETCLYSRLNAALRNHDKRDLEPFLPYMKLLLAGLYQLPLKHVRTYRGVKLDLFKVGGAVLW